MKKTVLVLSCEHAGNDIPLPYQSLFSQHASVLSSHRAVDFGALRIAQQLHQAFQCNFASTAISRLLIDCNRTLSNPRCFSEFTKSLPQEEKKIIINTYYKPYREKVEQFIRHHMNKGEQVLHLSVHTFTPELNGIKRNAAISLLYDPARHAEREVARIWQTLLLNHPPDFNVRLNYPYAGKNDGFTRYLREKYSEQYYLGFELESNQALIQDDKLFQELVATLIDSLKELLQML